MLSITSYFAVQKRSFNSLITEEQAHTQVLHDIRKETQRIVETRKFIQEMSKALWLQTGIKLYCKCKGPPKLLNKIAFIESMYAEVAQHLFH